MASSRKTSGHFNGVSKYFNKGDMNKYVGIVLISISVLLFFVGMGWISYIVMCTAFSVGLAILLIDSLNKFSDIDIDEFILREKQDLQDKINDMCQMHEIESQGYNVVVEGYVFAENKMIRQGRDGVVRTSEYVVSHMFLINKRLLIFERYIDILNNRTTDAELEFFIEEICDINVLSDLKTFEYKKHTYRVRQSFMTFKHRNEDVQFIVQDSLALDEFVDKIKRNID